MRGGSMTDLTPETLRADAVASAYTYNEKRLNAHADAWDKDIAARKDAEKLLAALIRVARHVNRDFHSTTLSVALSDASAGLEEDV